MAYRINGYWMIGVITAYPLVIQNKSKIVMVSNLIETHNCTEINPTQALNLRFYRKKRVSSMTNI